MLKERFKGEGSDCWMKGEASVRLILGWRERGISHLTPLKTVSTHQDHSLKECHPKLVSQPQMAGEKLSLKCVAENEGEKREKRMIG